MSRPKRKNRVARGRKVSGKHSSVAPRTKQAPRKPAAMGFAVLLLAVGVAVGGKALWNWADRSGRFLVETIDVVGNQRATTDTLLGLTGVTVGDNLLRVDSSALETALEAHPWVSSASVRRRWPKGLEVKVQEHLPIALVALEHLYYCDGTGEIVKRYSPGELTDLPLITGLDRSAIESGDSVVQGQLQAALDLIELLSAREQKAREVHVDLAFGLAFVDEDGVRIELGHGKLEPALARAAASKKALSARGLTPTRLSLGTGRRSDRVVARLAPAYSEDS